MKRDREKDPRPWDKTEDEMREKQAKEILELARYPIMREYWRDKLLPIQQLFIDGKQEEGMIRVAALLKLEWDKEKGLHQPHPWIEPYQET